jgi:hypothetical protein
MKLKCNKCGDNTEVTFDSGPFGTASENKWIKSPAGAFKIYQCGCSQLISNIGDSSSNLINTR